MEREAEDGADDVVRKPRGAGGYDEFAWLYDRQWGAVSLAFLPALESLVLDRVPAGSRILDLACGTGQLAAVLVERGFRVTGVDSSPEMLALARKRASQADFVVADARSFSLVEPFDAVVSVFDSLNHVMSVDDLQSVFAHVRGALVPGGRFVFDLNTERLVAGGSIETFIGEDHVAVANTGYDPDSKTMRFKAILFRPSGDLWKRTDIVLFQRCHSEVEVRDALQAVGFIDTDVIASETFALRPGRLFYAARVPP